MKRYFYDKLNEILKEVKQLAKDDYESGQPIDSDDFNEFQTMLDESDLNINHMLFDYYYDCFAEIEDY